MRLRVFLLSVCLVASLAAQTPNSDEFKNPLNGQLSAIEAGRGHYLKSCAGCHGPTGEGGRGPNLVTGRQIRRATDRQVFAAIEKGVPGTDMPPTPLGENAIWQTVAFVRSLSSPAFEVPVPGDERAGAAVYRGKGNCASCHAISGQGGSLGPDLTNIGMSRSLNQLREAVLNPGARWTDGYRGVTAHLKDGRRIEGALRDHTNYQLTILDARGQLHRLKMAAVADFKLATASLMPESRGRLTTEEIRDVVKYLSRQSARLAGE